MQKSNATGEGAGRLPGVAQLALCPGPPCACGSAGICNRQIYVVVSHESELVDLQDVLCVAVQQQVDFALRVCSSSHLESQLSTC